MKVLILCSKVGLLLLMFFLNKTRADVEPKDLWNITEIANHLSDIETKIEDMSNIISMTTDEYLEVVAFEKELAEIQHVIANQESTAKHIVHKTNLEVLSTFSKSLNLQIKEMLKQYEDDSFQKDVY